MQDLMLMSKDVPVMRINFDEGRFDILNDTLVPHVLKLKLKPVPTELPKTKYEETQKRIVERTNQFAIISWLADRVLLLSRKNAKWIYNVLNIEQLTDDISKAKVALMCRAVSLLDCYWVKLENDVACWDTINLRTNPLNEIIAQIALHGKSLTFQGSLTTPELTTNGSYAKAWRRHEDKSLWLYKLGDNDNTESRIEVMCSNLLDKMNVRHVFYEAGEDDGKYVCMCPCMSTERVGILSGLEYSTCCNLRGENPSSAILKLDAESMYKMWIVDYLISNRDRHGQNWGVFYDLKTLRLLCCHPLFDHNNAFDLEYMKDDNAHYQFENMTIKEAAMHAIQQVDFHFTEGITRDDFLTDRQYESFMRRAKQLSIIMKPPTFEEKFEQLVCAPYIPELINGYSSVIDLLKESPVGVVRQEFGVEYLQCLRDDILLQHI